MSRTSTLTKFLLTSVPVSGLVASSAAAHDETVYRLFIGDHADGIIRAVDLNDGTEADAFQIDQTPALTRSISGRTIYAVQGDAGKVAIIDTGIAFEDHGDHQDIKVTDEQLLSAVIEGTRRPHVVEGSRPIAIFDDGTGDVVLVSESDVINGSFDPLNRSLGAAHHGLAAPMSDFLVVSVPNEDPD